MKDEILAYYQTIEDGSVTVGKWVKLLYERIVEGIEDGKYILDPSRMAPKKYLANTLVMNTL